jgi:DNA-directed RNA polymerase specialized sigma24 family protein
MRVPVVSRPTAAQVRASPDAEPPTDTGAFESFYRAEIDRVYRALAVTLSDPHLAREAADEAMARAYMHWPRVAACDNPGGWVFRVGLNWATSWWRKFGRERPTLDESMEESGQPRADELRAADRRAADRRGLERRTAEPPDAVASAAFAALGRLPIAQRAVVVCRVLLDMTTLETAAVLGVAEGTVKSRLARGLAGLRRALGDDEEEASR